jgi:NADH dehydrogenase/putative oxidoreductase
MDGFGGKAVDAALHSRNAPLRQATFMETPGDIRATLWLTRLVEAHAELLRRVRLYGWPLADLLIRFMLARSLLASGTVAMTNWTTAQYLAAHEYPVSWMSPLAAAYIGVTIELLGGLLLLLGLLTRPAALAILMLLLVEHIDYLAPDTQLFAAALFGWYVVRGAGPLSLDAMLGRGFADSALPLAARLARLTAWLRQHATPGYLVVLRFWLGVALLIRCLLQATGGAATVSVASHWLPLATASMWPPAVAWLGAISLSAGIATRYAAIALLTFGSGAAMMHGMPSEALYLVATLAVLAVHGAGPLSTDAIAAQLLVRRYPQLQGEPAFRLDGLPRVVVVGAGFGGLACALALRRTRAAVTLIDRANHHLFQPLLYQVATAGLSPGDIAVAVRPMFRDSFNTKVVFGEVTGVDPTRRQVLLGARALDYDYLVLATGASHSYFGKDVWQSFAPGLKCIEDATEIRRRLLTAFEHAEATEDDAVRRELLTFLIVGGGPTGVELAGAIAELARFGMEQDFRNFDPAAARIVLVQSAPRVLPGFDARLSVQARRVLERLGVEVMVGSRVEHIDAAGVVVAGQRIAARTVLWAAGVTASPAAAWLGVEADAAGRVKVRADLSVGGIPNVYAIGDTALSTAWKGQAVPGLAPAAKQAGVFVARAIDARVRGRSVAEAFVYRHYGSLATIGRKAAVADFGRVRLWGAPAWWLWGLLHLGFLVGIRNRVATMINWFWAYLTFGGGIRLITGPGVSRRVS